MLLTANALFALRSKRMSGYNSPWSFLCTALGLYSGFVNLIYEAEKGDHPWTLKLTILIHVCHSYGQSCWCEFVYVIECHLDLLFYSR